ncbi:DUF4221 family protein [Algoriphagus sp.]|uniref:DUF4221 family protein n=1 Tax=Algoriphagus sp. TaxID=1872435 RepID=UPI00391DFB29
MQVVISRAKKLIGRISVLPFFFLLLFSSCFKSKFDFSNSNESKNYLKDSLFLQLDSKSSYDFTYFDLGIIEGKEKLIVLNQINSSFDFYNLADGELESRFIIQQDGPAQIRDIQGLLFHNKDSIFVFTSFLRSRFGLFNMEGELKSYYKPNIYSDNLLDQLLNHSSSPTVPTVFLNGKLFFSQLTLGNPAGNPVFSESHVPEFIYHLKNDSIEQINNLRMPLEFRGKTLPVSFTFQSKAFNSVNDLVFSWFGSDSIYVYDFNFNFKSKHLAKSLLSNGFEKTSNSLSKEESNRLIISQTHYPRLIYDSYRKLYYRFAHIRRAYDPNELIDHKSVHKNPFSITVMNENFEKLEEVIFPSRVYNLYQAFVAERGLFLPLTNPFFINLNENQVKYEVFDFSGF